MELDVLDFRFASTIMKTQTASVVFLTDYSKKTGHPVGGVLWRPQLPRQRQIWDRLLKTSCQKSSSLCAHPSTGAVTEATKLKSTKGSVQNPVLKEKIRNLLP